MNVGLLREYVELVMEKIRTQKNVKGKFGDKFDFNKFKTLPNAHVMLVYANHFLDPIGEGSSRRAFTLSSKYVLKIALNAKGIAQNQAEQDVYTNPKTKPTVAKIYQADDEDRWVISDLVKPITNENEFKELTRVPWENFVQILIDHLSSTGTKKAKTNEFIQSVIENARLNNLMPGDMTLIDHWGKTPDGRVVLLDYGFTKNVRDEHYSQPEKKAPTDPNDPQKTRKPTGGNTRIDQFGYAKTDVDDRPGTSATRTMGSPKDDSTRAAKPQPKKNPVSPPADPEARTAVSGGKGRTKPTKYR